jgi:spermidine synthase
VRVLGVAGLVVLGLLLWTGGERLRPMSKVIHRSRDFYGVLIVEEIGAQSEKGFRQLTHGTIRHGTQMLDRTRRTKPTSYYTPGTGIDMAFRDARPQPGAAGRRVGVCGLGAGTLASFARPGDVFRFYEIHPRVIALAKDPFTYLRDSAARCEVVLGDARLSLEREPDQRFDVLVLDAFSGDGIPVHLLTAEAFDQYRRHLAPDGVVAAHTTNRYVDLGPVLRRQAERNGWDAVVLEIYPSPDRGDMAEPSQWVVMSAVPDRLAAVRAAGGTPLPDDPGVRLWTDDRADLFRSLK